MSDIKGHKTGELSNCFRSLRIYMVKMILEGLIWKC